MSAEIRAYQAVKKQLAELSRRLEQLRERPVLRSPTGYIDQKRLELDFLRSRLAAAGERGTAKARREYVSLASSLDALSPLKVLERGYAVALDGEGNTLRAAGDVSEGQEISIQLSDGSLGCRVLEKRKGRPEHGGK